MVAESSRDLGRLHDRVALVTGGGSGIGRAIAERFAFEGARVVVVDINGVAADAVADAIGNLAFAIEADVSDPGSVRRMIDDAIERFGRVDVLVNNAAIVSTKDVLTVEPDEWDRVFAVNVRGVYLCCQGVLPSMLERGVGSIVNIASVAGMKGLPQRAAYCASKGAVIALTRQIAAEYAGRGVRCNCICPSTIATPLVESVFERADDPDALRATFMVRQPMGRFGQADEVAAAVLYLASDESAFVTGTSLVIDGGLTM